MENQKSKAYISLEEKSEECIAKKHSLYEYYKHLIVPKTYGTFRIYANSIEKLILNYNKSGHITDKEASELREYIAQKRLVKERVIECDVNLEKYLDDIESLIDTIEISNKKRNTIFSIFFSLINNIKTLINLKSEEVTIKETKHGIIVTVNVDGDVVNIVSRKYTKMFKKLFDVAMKDTYVFTYINQMIDQQRAYFLLNEDIKNELAKYNLESNVESISPFKIVRETYKKGNLKNIIFEI